MIRRISLALCASVIALTANAAPVELSEKPGSRELELVNIMFSSYLADRMGAAIQTAVVDLDGDGVGEIISRFVHSGSCDAAMQRCRTTISRFDRGRWNVVFDRHTNSFDNYEVGVRRPGTITVDGMDWTWRATLSTYQPTKDKRWADVAWQAVPSAQASAYASFFGEGAAKLATANQGVKLEYSTTPVSKENDLILLKMSGPSICGTETGCPIRMIKQTDGQWKPVLSSTTDSSASRVTTEREGKNDIAVETTKGFVVYGWNGSSYIVADRIESNRKE